jgi:hypothetical protein
MPTIPIPLACAAGRVASKKPGSNPSAAFTGINTVSNSSS